MRPLALLILALPAPAAPAPPHRPKPPLEVTPGAYLLEWASISCTMSLGPGGTYECLCAGSRWYGSWHWDTRSRTLRVRDTTSGEAWFDWAVALNDNLEGAAEYGSGRPAVKLTRIKER